jgi:hypothetical protein
VRLPGPRPDAIPAAFKPAGQRQNLEREAVMKDVMRGFPLLLLAAWMALSALTLTSFASFNAVTHATETSRK